MLTAPPLQQAPVTVTREKASDRWGMQMAESLLHRLLTPTCKSSRLYWVSKDPLSRTRAPFNKMSNTRYGFRSHRATASLAKAWHWHTPREEVW